MPNDEALLEQAGKKIRLPVSKEQFRIFVFGPALNPSEEVELPTSQPADHDGLQKHAKYLRYLTAKKLREAGWTVDFGETNSIQQFWSSLGIKNPAAMELSHAKKLCGAIIIFPTSVGAISELGLFVGFGSLAKKTLAIVHSEFRDHHSFFRIGLLKMLKIRNGTFEFEDYINAQKCIELALEFVEDQWTKLSLDDDLINEAQLLTLERKGGSFEKGSGPS
jgi:hypothetical protein